MLQRPSRNVPSVKIEQLGRPVYLDVVKELDAAYAELEWDDRNKGTAREPRGDNGILTKPNDRECSQQGNLKRGPSSERVLRFQVEYDPMIRGWSIQISSQRTGGRG